MSAGLSVLLCNSLLNTLRNTPFVAPITCIQLHDGDPGAAGTSNQSAVTERKAVVFTAGSSGGITLTGTPPEWDMTATETLTHISVWSGFDGDPEADFLWSMQLAAPKPVANGDKYIQSACNVTFITKAA